MKRDDFLAVTGISRDSLYAFDKRDALPFAIGEGLSPYDVHNALRLAVALELMALGMPLRDASAAVARSRELTAAFDLQDGPDQWFAVAIVAYGRTAEKTVSFLGSIDKLKQAEVEMARGVTMTFSEIEQGARAVALANVSRVCRTIYARAEALGIKENDE